ncbi:MAG: Rrf2 family transcriptional regulator [bacterium]|nr:Rrf2 family transcriptional regulator [bacterium]
MIFSKQTSYAIRALVYLAQNSANGPVLATTIAKAEHLPAPFLSKLMGELSANGIVSGARGPGGGFTFAKEPKDISLYDIFLLYDGLTLAKDCLLGCGICSDETACCIHQHWKQTKNSIEQFLKSTSIADLSAMREIQRESMLGRFAKERDQ